VTEFLEVNGRRYACDVSGSGPAVVLLHAAICNRHMYDPLIGDLEGDYRVLAYDQPGFGDTPLSGGHVSPVHDLAGLMDAVGMADAVLIGTSFGSRVAFDAALAIPNRVRAVVAAGPGLSGRQSTPGLQRAMVEVDAALQAGDVELANELEMRIWLDGVGRVRPVDSAVRVTVANMNRRILQDEMEGRSIEELPPRRAATANLSSIRCPVLVVVGECDQPQCVETAALIAHGVPDSRLVTLPETAHLPSLERPEEFTALVRDFLASLPPSGASAAGRRLGARSPGQPRPQGRRRHPRWPCPGPARWRAPR
jgi:pimeloyl-ACP methyl ester carboxylesterase